MKTQFFLLLLLLCSTGLKAQFDAFVPTSLKNADQATHQRRVTPNEASYFTVSAPTALATALAKAPTESNFAAGQELLLTLPNPDGQKSTFRITRYQMITDELQAMFPTFVTAYGWDVEAPYRKVFLEWTELGFSASITGGKEGRWYVAPTFWQRTDLYQSYYTRNYPARTGDSSCGFEPNEELRAELEAFGAPQKAVGDCVLREYDLALACTGEYFAAVGGTEAAVVSEMMTAINRVNEVFRADLAITAKIINLPVMGSIQLVYSNAATDPYTNSSGLTMLGENQTTIDNVIGTDNYDIGHVFSTGGGGIAALGSPCNSNIKAQGVTGLPAPTGDPFYIDFVAHEIGHQFGGNHSFNSTEGNCATRNQTTAYEPGGGTTIQAYAGICGSAANIQLNSEAYYHAVSIQEISAYMELGGGAGCATQLPTSNTAPTVEEGTGYTIPTNTPFVLTAVNGADSDGDALTYCWEQFDLGAVVAGEPTGNEMDGPLFRSLLPAPVPERYFPNLPSIVAGTSSWESLPLVARAMNFIVTIRDFGAAGYGCTVQDATPITVVNTGSQYAVAAPNGGEVWSSGGTETVTWNVAGTNINGINCANVDLVLSTDGGLTFTQVLATVLNNGSATITAPTTTETTARLMIRCSDNIFFDISDGDFRIEQVDYDYQGVTTSSLACNGSATADFSFSLESIMGYSGTINYTGMNLPAGATIAFTPTSTTLTAAEVATVNFTLSNLSGLAPGTYPFDVETNDGASTKSESFSLEVLTDLDAPTLTTPANSGFVTPGSASFDWSDVANADASGGYGILFYSDAAGNTQIVGNLSLDNSSANFGSGLDGNFTEGECYYWRAFARNTSCDPDQESMSPVQKFTWGEQPVTGASLLTGGSPLEVCAGETTAETYTVSFFDADLTGPVTLTATSVPAGLSIVIAPTMLSNGESATISLTGEETLAAGSYIITITANDGAATEDIDLILEITGLVNVTSPTDGQEFMVTSNASCSSTDGSIFVSIEFDPYSGSGTVEDYSLTLSNGSGNYSISNVMNSPFSLALCVDDGTTLTYTVTANLAGGDKAQSCERTFVARSVLPVTWLDFAARPAGKTALLNWAVEQDALNAGFSIERNDPGVNNWNQIGYVQRDGADGVANYQFTDIEISPGNTYNYRLRQEDSDGAASYSEIRAVTFGAAFGLSVFPNPANNFVILNTGSGVGENLQYVLYDPTGRKVSEGTMNGGQVRINMNQFPTAIYQILVTDGAGYREVVRVVKR
jgi:hypothetical protein